MSVNVSVSRLRVPRTVTNIDKIITNTPSGSEEDSGGSVTWVPENEAYNYVNADTLDVSDNGTYPEKEEEGSLYKEVKVNVEGGKESDSTELIDEKEITANGTYNAIYDATNSDTHRAGYEQVKVAVPIAAKVITANGQYYATDDISAEGDPVQAWSSVEVKVAGENGAGGRQISKTIKANGRYIATDEVVSEDEDPIQGYNQVDVALPMVTKKVSKNGDFDASDEQDANGDTALAYSEVEVGVEIIQPSFDFIMGIDRKPKRFSLPFSISINNTAQSDYTDFEKKNKPSVNFKNANIYIFTTGGGLSPFRVPNLNFGDKFCHSWPRTITVNGSQKKINTWRDADYYTRLNKCLYGFTTEKNEETVKYIMRGQFTDSGTGFVICGNYASSGYQNWIVPNVSYSKNQYYSFTITIKTASA